MIELTSDTLNEVLSQHTNVLVQFGAAWCGNCRMLKPKVKRLAGEHDHITFVYVDAEKYPESRQLATVDNLPTFALFSEGQLVNQNQGSKIELVQELINEASSN